MIKNTKPMHPGIVLAEVYMSELWVRMQVEGPSDIDHWEITNRPKIHTFIQNRINATENRYEPMFFSIG